MSDRIAGTSGRGRSDGGLRFCATAMLALALAGGCLLVAGATPSADARKLPKEPGLFVAANIDWNWAHKPGGGATGLVGAEGLFQATQTGPTTGKGTRPMAIIAILIGLKPEQDYALAFSTKRCGQGGGGLIGAGVKFTSSSVGEAVVKRRYRLKRKVLRRSKSVVLLSKETGRRFQSCGRFLPLAGDFNADGSVDASD